MEYKIATEQEIEEIYKTYMKKDFPPAELKPLKSIIHAVGMGWYKVFIAYDEEGIKGYANIADCGDKIGFLDYFAIVKKYRGTGIGTEFFKQLDRLAASEVVLLEVESVESAKNKEDEEIRKRRIAFYKRSGCIDTGCMYNVFGVEYNVFINKEIEITPEMLARLLSSYEYAYAAILKRDDKSYIKRVR